MMTSDRLQLATDSNVHVTAGGATSNVPVTSQLVLGWATPTHTSHTSQQLSSHSHVTVVVVVLTAISSNVGRDRWPRGKVTTSRARCWRGRRGVSWARGCLTVSDGLLAPLVPSDGPPTQHFSRHDGPRDISSKYSNPLISDLEHLARGVHLPPSPFSGFTFLHSSGGYRRERNERLPRWNEDDFAQNNVA